MPPRTEAHFFFKPLSVAGRCQLSRAGRNFMRDWIISARDAKRTHVTATKLYGRIEALTESAIAMRSLARNHRPVGYYVGAWCRGKWLALAGGANR